MKDVSQKKAAGEGGRLEETKRAQEGGELGLFRDFRNEITRDFDNWFKTVWED